MPVRADDGLLEFIADHSGGFTLTVRGAKDVDAVRRGLARAADRVAAIGHPEQPEEQYASAIRVTDLELSADMHDAEVYDGILEAVIAAVIGALEDAGVDDAVVVGQAQRTSSPQTVPSAPFVLPPNVPLHPEAIDVTERGVVDDGFVNFWVPGASQLVVAWYVGELGDAGFEVEPPHAMRVHGTPIQWDTVEIGFRGHGWAGDVVVMTPSLTDTLHPRMQAEWLSRAQQVQIQLSLWEHSAATDDALRAGRAPLRHRYRYDGEALHQAVFLVQAEDLGADWSAGIQASRRSPYRFCPEDTLVRRGPNSRPGGVSNRTLLSHAGGRGWIEQHVEVFRTSDEARAAWAWVPLDLKVCRSFSGPTPLGFREIPVNGTWTETPIDDSPDDMFCATAELTSADGLRVDGRKVLFVVERFLGSIYAFGVADFELPDVKGLSLVARERLAAVAEAFPSPWTRRP